MTAEKGKMKKKPYTAPRLLKYGDLARITKVKGGNKNDGGGKPKTRASGSNA